MYCIDTRDTACSTWTSGVDRYQTFRETRSVVSFSIRDRAGQSPHAAAELTAFYGDFGGNFHTVATCKLAIRDSSVRCSYTLYVMIEKWKSSQ